MTIAHRFSARGPDGLRLPILGRPSLSILYFIHKNLPLGIFIQSELLRKNAVKLKPKIYLELSYCTESYGDPLILYLHDANSTHPRPPPPRYTMMPMGNRGTLQFRNLFFGTFLQFEYNRLLDSSHNQDNDHQKNHLHCTGAFLYSSVLDGLTPRALCIKKSTRD